MSVINCFEISHCPISRMTCFRRFIKASMSLPRHFFSSYIKCDGFPHKRSIGFPEFMWLLNLVPYNTKCVGDHHCLFTVLKVHRSNEVCFLICFKPIDNKFLKVWIFFLANSVLYLDFTYYQPWRSHSFFNDAIFLGR